jgi:hypothetical protein
MRCLLVRSFVAGLALAPAICSSTAWALDPGNYTVQCTSVAGASDTAKYDIRMDVVDLLTLKNSFGAVISGVRLDDGKRVILTGDRGCALIEVAANPPRR